MELVPVSTAAVAWLSSCSDPPKLASLALFPNKYPGVTLLSHPSDPYALAYEIPSTSSAEPEYARVTIYTDMHSAPRERRYRHAAQQLMELKPPALIKFSALPEAGVSPVTEVLKSHGLDCIYDQPCVQYIYTQPPTHQANSDQLISLPTDYTIDVLKKVDAVLVDSLWTFRCETWISLVLTNSLLQDAYASGSSLAGITMFEAPCGSPATWHYVCALTHLHWVWR